MTATNETVAAGLRRAQDLAYRLLDRVEQLEIVRPGQTEKQISLDISRLAGEELGFESAWHENMIRSGPNTLLTFADALSDRTVEADDIVYADLGPIFQAHKADFARTWVLGDDADKHKITADARCDLERGMQRMRENPDMTGEDVYTMVGQMAAEAGWEYRAAIAGHIVGTVPDAEDAKFLDPDTRSEIVLMPGHTRRLSHPRPDGLRHHWVLEVHYVDTERKIGAFFEDIATV